MDKIFVFNSTVLKHTIFRGSSLLNRFPFLVSMPHKDTFLLKEVDENVLQKIKDFWNLSRWLNRLESTIIWSLRNCHFLYFNNPRSGPVSLRVWWLFLLRKPCMMMILVNMLAFCLHYWQIWSSFQPKNQTCNFQQILWPAHLFLIQMNANLIANEALSLDLWQIAILALSAESLGFSCYIFLTWFRK